MSHWHRPLPFAAALAAIPLIPGLAAASPLAPPRSARPALPAGHPGAAAPARLGGRAPGAVITSVTNYTQAQNPFAARKVDGYINVPSYLDQPGGPPGSRLHYASPSPGPDALPGQIPGNVQQAQFEFGLGFGLSGAEHRYGPTRPRSVTTGSAARPRARTARPGPPSRTS